MKWLKIMIRLINIRLSTMSREFSPELWLHPKQPLTPNKSVLLMTSWISKRVLTRRRCLDQQLTTNSLKTLSQFNNTEDQREEVLRDRELILGLAEELLECLTARMGQRTICNLMMVS